MKASDARKLMREPDENTVRDEIVKAVRASWDRAIEKAARAGRSSVKENEVDRLRTPVTAAERMAVLNSLGYDGFTIDHEARPVLVSW